MLAFAAAVFGAPDAPPATQPAPAAPPAATLPSDASTPRGALRMVFNATDAGDEAALRALLYTSNQLEERVADATAKLSSSTVVLHKALTTLGPDAAKAVIGDVPAAARARDARIPYLAETISADGNTAVVRMDGLAAMEPVEFRKVDGKWKWRVGKSVEGVPPQKIEERMAMLGIQAKVNTDTAADIHAGKLKTVADVKQTMEARTRQRVMEYVQSQQKTGATTQPAK